MEKKCSKPTTRNPSKGALLSGTLAVRCAKQAPASIQIDPTEK